MFCCIYNTQTRIKYGPSAVPIGGVPPHKSSMTNETSVGSPRRLVNAWKVAWMWLRTIIWIVLNENQVCMNSKTPALDLRGQIFRIPHPHSFPSFRSLALVCGNAVTPHTGPPGQPPCISASAELPAWLCIGSTAKRPGLIHPSLSELIIFP